MIKKVSKASVEMSPWPSFLQDRVAYFEKLMARHRAEIAAKVRRFLICRLMLITIIEIFCLRQVVSRLLHDHGNGIVRFMLSESLLDIQRSAKVLPSPISLLPPPTARSSQKKLLASPETEGEEGFRSSVF